MSIGSRKSLGESRLAPLRHLSAWLCFFLVSGTWWLAGCHQATLKGGKPHTTLNDVAGEDLFAAGISHAAVGDLLRAEQYLTAARLRGYDESTVVYWLVRVCVAASRYQSALRHSSDYLRRHPSDWSLRLIVASIHEALGDASRARDELERIVSSRPDHALPHYRLALVYFRHDDERARSHFEAYLRLAPDGPHAPEVRSALARVADVLPVLNRPVEPAPVESLGDSMP